MESIALVRDRIANLSSFLENKFAISPVDKKDEINSRNDSNLISLSVIQNVCLIKNFPDLHGLYQVTGDIISKFDLLNIINNIFELGITVVPDASVKCDRSMIGAKFEEDTGIYSPDWISLIRELKIDMEGRVL